MWREPNKCEIKNGYFKLVKWEFMSPVSPNLAGERVPSRNIIFSLIMLLKRLMRSVHAIINGYSGVTPIYSSPITFIDTSIPNPNHKNNNKRQHWAAPLRVLTNYKQETHISFTTNYHRCLTILTFSPMYISRKELMVSRRFIKMTFVLSSFIAHPFPM